MEQLNNNATLRAVWLARHPGFTFIHSDTWNNDEEKLQKYGELVKGSFTFGFNTDDFGVRLTFYLLTNSKSVALMNKT